MENLRKLFFELSSEDRLRILQQLNKKAMNVTGLSKKLDLTTQESSRHVSRLSDVGLAQKDSNGLYHLTLHGRLVLKQLQGLTFTSQHKDYFTSHSLANLPSEFISRIGDLSGSKYVNDISAAYSKIERLIQEADEYLLVITDHYLMSILPLLRDAFKREVKTRNIEAKDWVVPFEIKERVRDLPWYQPTVNQARQSELLQERLLQRLDVYLYMSEKEVAMISFPLAEGTFDYLGFTSKDEASHKWCRDLFEHYWERAPSRETLASELHKWIEKRPQAINVLRNIGAGKEIVHGKEQISELESRSLVKGGKPTILGDMILLELQTKRIDTKQK